MSMLVKLFLVMVVLGSTLSDFCPTLDNKMEKEENNFDKLKRGQDYVKAMHSLNLISDELRDELLYETMDDDQMITHHRTKRSIANLFSFLCTAGNPDELRSVYSYTLAAQVACVQRLPNWKQLNTILYEIAPKYLTYGCYCGYGGAGKPVDRIDACCKTHDACVTDQANSGVPVERWPTGSKFYLTAYTVRCNETTHKTDCSPSAGDVLESYLCNCDQVFANCIRKADPDFEKWNPRNDCIRGFPGKKNCGCKDRHPIGYTKKNKCPLPLPKWIKVKW